MNIYMTVTNEKRLRDYGGSMSGLVNRLLDDFFNKGTDTAPHTASRVSARSSKNIADVDYDVLQEIYTPAKEPD